ncbi:MAG: M28 family peptidase [Novosphingobium sp.]
MHRSRLVAALAVTLLASSPAVSAAVKPSNAERALEAALRRHITVLASDEYQGREPGTAGETLTLRYLAREWFRIGLVSGTNDPGNDWFAPVELVEREPALSSATFARAGRRLVLPAEGVLALTSSPRQLIENAPLLFVGHAAGALPPRAALAGRIAVLLDSLPSGSDAGAVGDRQSRLIAAGASAVLTVLDGERTLGEITSRRHRAGYALAGDALGGDLEAFVTRANAARLFGHDFAAMLRAAGQAGFVSRPLPLTGSIEATTRETRISSHNLIGRLPGRNPARGAVLLVAHWDHFGVCAEPPAEDLICNGAIDNASGLAVLTEVARVLARGKRLDRDVYFLATTGEELGLLGAHAFADNPPLPLEAIVAAFNIDSPALAPRGGPLAIVGHGRSPPLDRDIHRLAKAQKRRVVQSAATETLLRRQDGWALVQHDIPAVMVSSSAADAGLVDRFMEDTYHRPGDEAGPGLELGGAAQDALFHVALARWFASTKSYPSRAGR